MIDRLPNPPQGQIGWPWTESSRPPATAVAPNQDWPRITVVTPSYNQGQFIETTLRSVILQEYPNLEYLVMDGGSTDETVTILRRYDPWLTHWVSEPDRGQSHAINKGLSQGTGQIFTWLNSDDLLMPGALWHMARAYQQQPQAAGWVGSCHLIRPDGRIKKTVAPHGLDRDSLADWFYGGYIFQPACFFAAAAWKTIGGIDESLNYAMDFDLWLRLAEVGEFFPLPHTIAAAIIHDEAKTQASRLDMHLETMVVQFRNGYHHLAVKRLERLLETTAADQKATTRWKSRFKQQARKLFGGWKRSRQHIWVSAGPNL